MSDTRAAADSRDAARRRVRRITATAVAGSVAVAGSIAAYVAGASTGHKALGTKTTSSPSATTQATEVPVPVTPAAPSLDSSAQQQTPTTLAPTPAPTQSASPPVAASGGS
jgi:hypothetical protein